MRDEPGTARLRALAAKVAEVKARAQVLQAQLLVPGGEARAAAILEELQLLNQELQRVRTALEHEQKQPTE